MEKEDANYCCILVYIYIYTYVNMYSHILPRQLNSSQFTVSREDGHLDPGEIRGQSGSGMGGWLGLRFFYRVWGAQRTLHP